MDELVNEFLDETGELLATVSEDIMSLERAWDIEVINRIYRAFHSIKGNGAMLGFDRVSAFAHTAEDLLSLVRNRELEVTRPVADAILQALDAMTLILADIRNGHDDSRDTTMAFRALEHVIAAPKTRHEHTAICATDEKVKGNPCPPISCLASTEQKLKPEANTPNAHVAASSGVDFDLSEPECTDYEKIISHPDLVKKNISVSVKSVPGRELKILIVEDDFTSRQILNGFLSKYGECHQAKDGLEAIDAFSLSHESSPPQPYDLICMDINMPKMDGIRATKLMREIERGKGIEGTEYESAIIIASAVDDPATIIKACYECGANYYFIKPLDFNHMTRQMQKLSLIM